MGSKVNRKPMASEDEDVHAYSIFKKISRIKITVSDCGMTLESHVVLDACVDIHYVVSIYRCKQGS